MRHRAKYEQGLHFSVIRTFKVKDTLCWSYINDHRPAAQSVHRHDNEHYPWSSCRLEPNLIYIGLQHIGEHGHHEIRTFACLDMPVSAASSLNYELNEEMEDRQALGIRPHEDPVFHARMLTFFVPHDHPDQTTERRKIALKAMAAKTAEEVGGLDTRWIRAENILHPNGNLDQIERSIKRVTDPSKV